MNFYINILLKHQRKLISRSNSKECKDNKCHPFYHGTVLNNEKEIWSS